MQLFSLSEDERWDTWGNKPEVMLLQSLPMKTPVDFVEVLKEMNQKYCSVQSLTPNYSFLYS